MEHLKVGPQKRLLGFFFSIALKLIIPLITVYIFIRHSKSKIVYVAISLSGLINQFSFIVHNIIRN